MAVDAEVVVWSAWSLHADAVVAALRRGGLEAQGVRDPRAAEALLVVGLPVADMGRLLRSRRSEERATIVWGGTLPLPRIAALREAGCAGYVSMLQSPGELARVVRQVIVGADAVWPDPLPHGPPLTSRELEVAQAYLVRWADRPRAEVAARLGVSDRTLKVHIANIRAKSGHEGTATREGLRRALVLQGRLD
ncbi:LuxR C-terminal-related transcriptional regulator [Janibacter sp. GS2]|uniref:LuxR C-terminal-related transcriptional regulator n=1 Tax=Janibacter sp. GS2 TaxID=3442646 RepID=UPI003EBDE375